MIPGADKKLVEGFLAWVDAAEPADRPGRLEGLRKLLLDGADKAEAARVEALLKEAAQSMPPPDDEDPDATPGDVKPEPPKSKDGVPVSSLLPTLPTGIEWTPTARRARKRVRVYDPDRRGHRRSTKEEGLGEELKAMHAEASGTPFYEEPSEVVKKDLVAQSKAVWAAADQMKRVKQPPTKK